MYSCLLWIQNIYNFPKFDYTSVSDINTAIFNGNRKRKAITSRPLSGIRINFVKIFSPKTKDI